MQTHVTYVPVSRSCCAGQGKKGEEKLCFVITIKRDCRIQVCIHKDACMHACTRASRRKSPPPPAELHYIIRLYKYSIDAHARVFAWQFARVCSICMYVRDVRGGTNTLRTLNEYSGMCATCAQYACTLTHREILWRRAQRAEYILLLKRNIEIYLLLNIIKCNDIKYQYSHTYTYTSYI